MATHRTNTARVSHHDLSENDDPETLRFAMRLLLDFHGPVAVISYARDRGIPCANCYACGWSPMLNDECLLCDHPSDGRL